MKVWSVKQQKRADFLPMNRHISETIENRHIVTIEISYWLSIGTNFDDLK